MPLVQIRFNSAGRNISQARLRPMMREIPRLVVRMLTCEKTLEGKVEEEEVIVECAPSFEGNAVNMPDLFLMIFANDYPERRENLGRKIGILKDAISAWLPSGATGGVYVFLGHGAYAEIKR